MYNFIDVTEVSEGNLLPSEALKLNSEYIENLIPGYRTLAVSGREALSPELSTYESGVRDGSSLLNRRYPARTIVVKYQLMAETSEAFREAYNQLGKILNVENAEMIFNDEPDKFYIGTPSLIDEVDPGTNAVVGEIEFLCLDPFKYSVVEYEAEPSLDESSVLIDYNGTYKSFPVLEADFFSEKDVADDGETAGTLTGSGDCGYVAFFTEDEKIIQLGNPNEEDIEEAYAKSQTLMNQTFLSSTAWGTTAKSLWGVNNGTVLPTSIKQLGSVAMKVASYTPPPSPTTTTATILNKAKTTVSAPTFYYTIKAKTTSRNATSVKVSLTITTSLGSSGSYFGRGYGLRGSVYIGGSWHNITIKNTSSYWKGKSGHTVSMAVTVSGLSGTTSSISGIKFKVTRTDSLGTAGTLKETSCKSLPVSTYIASVPETYYLAASSYGSASGAWHGPSITRTLPADAAGDIGAQNFTLTYKQKMSISSSGTGQLGAFQVQVVGTNGEKIAGVRIYKNTSGKSGRLVLYIDGAQVYTGSLDLSYNNKYFGAKESSVQTSTISKSGSKITFSIGGVKKTFTDSGVSAAKARKVTFTFEQYSTKSALSYNGLYRAKFVKNNCETEKDIPNKFSADDVIEADCKNGDIRLNGILSPQLGALGNDWEGFYLTPGLNQIGISYSEWVPAEYAPAFKVRYREVFL